MSVKDLSDWYGYKRPTIYNILKEMETCGRYGRIALNEYGDRLIDTLCFEDYLLHRTELKNKNLARRLPPYDPVEIRKRRGEYQMIKEVI